MWGGNHGKQLKVFLSLLYDAINRWPLPLFGPFTFLISLSLSLSLSLSFSLSLALLHKSNYLWRIFCAPGAPRPLIMPGMSCKVDGQFESGISISKQVETKLYLSSFHPPFKISASNKSISLQTSFCGMHQVGRSVVGVKWFSRRPCLPVCLPAPHLSSAQRETISQRNCTFRPLQVTSERVSEIAGASNGGSSKWMQTYYACSASLTSFPGQLGRPLGDFELSAWKSKQTSEPSPINNSCSSTSCLYCCTEKCKFMVKELCENEPAARELGGGNHAIPYP